MSDSGLTSLGPGRAAATAVDWPPSAGDPGGHDAGVTGHSVRSWCHPWFNKADAFACRRRTPQGLGCRQTSALTLPGELGGRHSPTARPAKQASASTLLSPQSLGSPKGPPHLCPLGWTVVLPEQLGTAASQGHCPRAPGTQGQTPFIPRMAPLQQARPRDGVSWGRAGPRPSLKQQRRGQSSKPEERTASSPRLLSAAAAPSWALSEGQGGVLALEWLGDGGLTRASRAQGYGSHPPALGPALGSGGLVQLVRESCTEATMGHGALPS